MKILLLITILFIASLTTIKAQTFDKKIIQFKKPEAKYHLSKEEFERKKAIYFKQVFVPDYNDDTYFINGVLLTYLKLQSNPPFKRSLEIKLKQNIDVYTNTYEKLKTDFKIKTAKIVSISGIRFSIFEYSSDGGNVISFSSDYNQNNEYFHGLIQYNDADYQKAHVILDELLNSMHFNN